MRMKSFLNNFVIKEEELMMTIPPWAGQKFWKSNTCIWKRQTILTFRLWIYSDPAIPIALCVYVLVESERWNFWDNTKTKLRFLFIDTGRVSANSFEHISILLAYRLSTHTRRETNKSWREKIQIFSFVLLCCVYQPLWLCNHRLYWITHFFFVARCLSIYKLTELRHQKSQHLDAAGKEKN